MTKRSAYNLPAAWDPGFAVPAYVEAEGLGRGTFTTAWMPRGSYGPGVVDYLNQPMTEVADIARRGDQVDYKLETMGALSNEIGMTDPIAAYGRSASRFLVQRVMALPPAKRAPALKLVLDKIDPTLHARAGQIATQAKAQGMSPRAALERGLAAAMSDGVLKELVTVGKRSQAPAVHSLLGLSCYGCGTVLGDVVESLTSWAPKILTTPVAPSSTASGATGVTVRDSRGQTSTTPRTTVPSATGDQLAVGPFVFGAGGGRIRVNTAALPATWKNYFAKEVQRLTARIRPAANGISILGAVAPPTVTMPAGAFGLDTYLGLPADMPVIAKFFDGTMPIAKAKNPATGQTFGLFVAATPAMFQVTLAPVNDAGWLGKLLGYLTWLPVKLIEGAKAVAGDVYDFAKDAAGWLKDMGCKLVNNPATGAVAAGAATATGGPAAGAAAQKGTGIAQNLCNTEEKVDEPAVPQAPATQSGSSFLPLAIGGAALAALALLGG